MHKTLAVLAVLALGGCATASPTVLKNGKQGLDIDCSGQAMSWDSCYQKAQASCDGGDYDIIGTDGTPQPKPSDKTLGADIGNYKSRSVTVMCK
ncbi:MAG: hypothetical protein PW845_21890 [Pseudomonas sp.]|uniref:hypothetical protein n=1 Tax=Pseudomonas abieticivorans TaxID=2931382 RepID=UPI0020BE0814|nr:hypothetical protein [Pseudomonas sp. PIA16]MDE1167957.1 hypothetical protein [Pseudomonas sp.]